MEVWGTRIFGPNGLWDRWVECLEEKGFKREDAGKIVAYIMSDPRIWLKWFSRSDGEAKELLDDVLEVLSETEIVEEEIREALREATENWKEEITGLPLIPETRPVPAVAYFRGLTFKEVAHRRDKEIEGKDEIAKTLENIGLIHHERGEYDKALEFYKEALK
ncbi:MAG: tetratricopeptide repeat protein, partial [Candidatus Bathyarchaeia archaeon]